MTLALAVLTVVTIAAFALRQQAGPSRDPIRIPVRKNGPRRR